jgi:AI-2 transport protein TqsA
MAGWFPDPAGHPMDAPSEPVEPDLTRWRGGVPLRTVAYVLVIAAAGWFLLAQLAPILRPLLVAVFLAYVLLPYHARLRRYVPGAISIGLLAGVTVGLLVLLGLAVSASVSNLNDELPRLQERASDLARELDRTVARFAPWVSGPLSGGKRVEEQLTEQAGGLARATLNAAAGALTEACVVGLYLLFLLAEASRFPDRVRQACSPDRAEEILQLAGQVNAAVVSYLRAKVLSSLVLAVPVGLVLWGFGVRFALLWAVLTFLCNFIPYIGSVVAFTLPAGFAFLQLDLGWEPVAVAGLVLTCHLVSASVAEPLILGRAVGLSPLVILGSLAFWGLLWGLPGMFLAVPLTAVAVIVMGQFPPTRAVARLIGSD